MIVACSNNIKEIHYNGYTITNVYACGGQLVYGEEPIEEFYIKVRYSGGTVLTKECLVGSGYTAVSRSDIVFNDSISYEKIWIHDCSEGGIVPTAIGNSAFSNINTIKEVNLCNTITSISSCAFQYTPSLETINLDYITSIGAHAFNHCSGLTEVYLPSIQTIGRNAFEDCPSLTSVTIGTDCQYIVARAFYNCTSLQSITVLKTTPPSLRPYEDASTPLQKQWFNNTNNCPIYVLAESVNQYKTATYWSDYANRIQAIP